MTFLSNHAMTRSQQRGIPLNITEFIFRYGEPIDCPGEAIRYRLNSQLANHMVKDLKKMIELIDRARSKVVIANECSSKIITVYSAD
jgi:hypothetical protein